MIDPHNSTLVKMPSGCWSLNGIELTAGSYLQINIGGNWIDIRIERDSTGYYAIPRAVRLHKGLWARFYGEWAE